MKSLLYLGLVILAVTVASGKPGPEDSSDEFEDNEHLISPPLPPKEFWQRLRSTLHAAVGIMAEINKIPAKALIQAYRQPETTAYQRLTKAAGILELRAQLLRAKAAMFLPHHDIDENLEEALELLRGRLATDKGNDEGSGEAENMVGDN